MAKKTDGRDGVPPPRDETFERVLLPGGRQTLTLAQLEKQCLARLTALVADVAILPPDGYRTCLRIGDFSILII